MSLILTVSLIKWLPPLPVWPRHCLSSSVRCVAAANWQRSSASSSRTDHSFGCCGSSSSLGDKSNFIDSDTTTIFFFGTLLCFVLCAGRDCDVRSSVAAAWQHHFSACQLSIAPHTQFNLFRGVSAFVSGGEL